MTSKENYSRLGPFGASDRDPAERDAYYDQAMVIIEFGREPPRRGDVFGYSTAEFRSVAERVAAVVEAYILGAAEQGYSGEITFKVYVPDPVLNRSSSSAGSIEGRSP